MSFIIHQHNFSASLGYYPKRIISLVPSQTELLYDMGLDEEVVGITKFCIHPNEWFRKKTRIGGTKTVHIEKVKELQPDLILANKEENIKEQIESLQAICPVYVSDIATLQDALVMTHQIGILVQKEKKSAQIIKDISTAFDQLMGITKTQTPIRTIYLIWNNPYMTIGGDTFISHMMQLCGFENVFATQKRYPQIAPENIQASGCQLILLSSEPYPFKQKHIEALQKILGHEKVIHPKILLVDGEMFSWYGSRLLQAPRYFRQLTAQIMS